MYSERDRYSRLISNKSYFSSLHTNSYTLRKNYNSTSLLITNSC